MKKIISVCVLLVMAIPSIAEETLLESIKSPIPVAMELRGCEEYSGNHLLIAGTNATAIITIKDYYPEWTEWLEGGRNAGYARYGGRFRHKIKSIIVVAYPGAELLDENAEKWWDGTEYWNSMFRNNSYTSPACQMSEYVCSGENLAVLNLEDHHCQATVEFTLNKGDGYHGEFYWTAIVEYEHEDEQGIYPYSDYEGPISSLMESLYILDWACGCSEKVADAADIDGTEGSHLLLRDETGRVFFDKDQCDYNDSKGRPVPNWYRYWKDDGAVPQLSEVAYEREPTGYCSLFARGGEEEVSFVSHTKGISYGDFNILTGKISIHERAGDGHIYAPRVSERPGWVYAVWPKIPAEGNPARKFWDPREYGIYTLQNVIAHETEHKRLYEEYWTEVGLHTGYEDRRNFYDSDMELVDRTVLGIVWGACVGYKDSSGQNTGEIFYEKVHCDWLTNMMETNTYKMFALSPYSLDTMCLGIYKDKPYRYTGDNEFLAMQAGYDANFNQPSRVVDEKDWAFPGQQSFIPAPFIKMKSNGTAITRVALATAESLAGSTTTDESEDSSDAGEMSCVSIEQKLMPAMTGTRYSGIEYNLKFDVCGTNNIEFIAYLSDINSNFVASISATQKFTANNNECKLFFNGQEIYRSEKNGPYMLLGIVALNCTDVDKYFHSAVSGFNLPNLECTYTDFINGDATILRDGITENVTSNGLFVSVNVESQVNNAFQLSADILDADGSKIVTVTTNVNCTVGTNQFILSLTSSKIKSSRKNGPYTISNVKLKNDTIDVDQAAALYTTTMSDFASYFGFTEDPTKTVVVDGLTWRCQVVDGKAIIKHELEYYGYKFNYCAVTPVPSGALSIPSLLRNWPVVSIGEEAFTDCDTVTEIAIPATVTNISSDAFKDCSSLTNLIFNGNAPVVADDVFADVAEGCFITANADSTGWDDDGDGLWNGLPIVYVSNGDPIPQIDDDATADDVAAALSGSKDDNLTANITNAANYNAYRSWAETVKKSDGSAAAGTQAVKDSPNAWLSFAIGSQKLIDATPTNGQMKIDQFSPTSTAGSFDFTVSIDDVSVGSDATAENLKKVFGLEGGSTLKDMSSTNVNITFGTPSNGKVKFTAGPKDTKQSPFFMKVKMTP